MSTWATSAKFLLIGLAVIFLYSARYLNDSSSLALTIALSRALACIVLSICVALLWQLKPNFTAVIAASAWTVACATFAIVAILSVLASLGSSVPDWMIDTYLLEARPAEPEPDPLLPPVYTP